MLHRDSADGSLYTRFFTENLAAKWHVENDKGLVSDLLNLKIQRSDRHVTTLSQTGYIGFMVDTFFSDGVPSSVHRTQAPASEDFPKLVDAAFAAKAEWSPKPDLMLGSYQSLVGAWLYCSTQTRPDGAHAVGMLCRAMSCPTPALSEAATRVQLCLYHHRYVGLKYELCPDGVHGHSDSD
eukprot:6208883-Pleurochrysis_carterae.AAC.2